ASRPSPLYDPSSFRRPAPGENPRKGSSTDMAKTLSLVVCLAFILALAPQARAQQAASATLNGRVTDSAGAVVGKASITATQKSTGAAREATTNDEGMFALTNLPAGEYDVKVQAATFADQEVAGVVLRVGQTRSLDVELRPNAISEHQQAALSGEGLVDT